MLGKCWHSLFEIIWFVFSYTKIHLFGVQFCKVWNIEITITTTTTKIQNSSTTSKHSPEMPSGVKISPTPNSQKAPISVPTILSYPECHINGTKCLDSESSSFPLRKYLWELSYFCRCQQLLPVRCYLAFHWMVDPWLVILPPGKDIWSVSSFWWL